MFCQIFRHFYQKEFCLIKKVLKGPIPSLKNGDKTRNQRVVTLRINSACETMEFYRCNIRYRTANLSGGAPLFIMCLCLQSTKVCPVHLYHRVYLVDRNFLVQKYIFSCLPGTVWYCNQNRNLCWIIAPSG